MREDPLRKLARQEGHYAVEAYQFLFEALDHSVRRAGKEEAEGAARHVSGRDLVEGMRELALEHFGPLAANVWRRWGVHSTFDWGRIVFLLVDAGLLNRQDSDTIDEFRDVFDLEEALVEAYRPRLPQQLGGGEEREA